MHIEIWQVKRNLDVDISFMDYDFVSKKIDFKKYTDYYNKVYEYDTESYKNMSVSVILEHIFTTFNIARPEDFTGHSLSTSDIVCLDDVKYFCDSFGFKEIEV